MPKPVKIFLAVILGFGLLVGLYIVDQFIYPFTAGPPSFSDVETVFNRIQIPADWKEVSSSENRGIRGKRCPIESDGCFNKVKNFKLPVSTPSEKIKSVLLTSECPVVSTNRSEPIGAHPYTEYVCLAPNTAEVSATTKEAENDWDISIIVSVRR